MKILPWVFAYCMFSVLAATAQTISNMTVSQRPGTKKVDICYDVAHTEPYVDISLTVSNGIIPTISLSGDVGMVAVGSNKKIVWDAGADWDGNAENLSFKVSARYPLYMSVDISGGSLAATYPTAYYATSASVPGGINNNTYKTEKLLFRLIPQGSLTMGSPTNETGRLTNENQHLVTLTKDFYLGVYEMTQRQWELLMGNRPSYFINTAYYYMRPVEQVSYYEIRENPANSDDPAVQWPSDSTVNANSCMGKLRAKTGMNTFDLPTEAQWEYACRGGTATALNSGKNLTSPSNCVNMAEVGRYLHNGGLIIPGYVTPAASSTTANGTDMVGSYLPNAWGLYDMHGNVYEWCLDWYGTYPADTSDPAGMSTGSARVLRGGVWNQMASGCRSASRNSYAPNRKDKTYGLRVARHLSYAQETANAYVTQQIDTRNYTLEIVSAHGVPSPSVGTHTYFWRSAITASVNQATSTPGTNFTCTGWVGTGTIPTGGSLASTGEVILNNFSSSITWQWTTNYLCYIATAASGNGNVSGGGWYTAGAQVELVATPNPHHRFTTWSDGITTTNRTVIVPEGGASYTAIFEPIPRGILQVEQSSYSVNEGDTVIALKVMRLGGSYGAAQVAYSIEPGSATAGSDYSDTSGILNWGDGVTTTRIILISINNDSDVEDSETFSLRLTDATGATLGDISTSVITIIDNDVLPSRVMRLDGTLSFGEVETNSVVTRVLHVWNDGNASLSVTRIDTPSDFSATPQTFAIPAGTMTAINVKFAPQTLGTYSGLLNITCNATAGMTNITLSGTGILPIPPAGTRKITGLTAMIAVDVPEGEFYTMGVEDQLPPGMIPLSISDGGVWDPINRKVKWFFNEAGQIRDRALQYRVNITGSVIAGFVNFGAENKAIRGDMEFSEGGDPGLIHPADDNGDWRVELSEISMCVSRWKNGLDNLKTPNVIRGISLYLQGEYYAYDGTVSAEAKRWIPSFEQYLMMGMPEALADETFFSAMPEGGGLIAARTVTTNHVTIRITPPVETKAWGMEESLPAGVTIVNISNDGAWDANNRKVKWAFFDGFSRDLSYTVSGEAGTNVALSGTASFDGSEDPATGDSNVWIPLSFSAWASRNAIIGDLASFGENNPLYGQPNGIVYACQSSFAAGEELMKPGVTESGLYYFDIPVQEPYTLSFVDLIVEGATSLGSSAWTLPIIEAADQTGVPPYRRRVVPQGNPPQAFLRLRVVPK